MERDVPGMTALTTWHRPIQIACGRFISSTCVTEGSRRLAQASTTHITMPPISSASAITVRFSRF